MQDLIPANALPSSAADTEEDSRQAKLGKMRKALEEAGMETVSRADAHASQLEAENKALRVQVSSLSLQLTAAQQSSAFFRRLLFTESRKRFAADKRAKSALQQTAAQPLKSAVPTHEVSKTQDKNNINGSATAEAGTSTASYANPSSDANASTAGAGISTAAASNSTAAASTDAAPATATEAAPRRALSTAHTLRLSAEMRVQELSSANASLQRRLKETSADLQQAEAKMGKQDIKFFQADKMRQRAQEDLSGVAAERNHLLRLVSDLLPEQAQANSLPIPANQDTGTYKDMPDGNCLQQALPSEVQVTPDQIFPQTPIKTRAQAQSHHDMKQFQTDNHNPQIPAVHAWQGQLYQLQEELASKQEVIERQAADITDASVKMIAQQGMVQQLQADLRARELAALLFHVRLVPTRVSLEFPICKGLLVCCIAGKTTHIAYACSCTCKMILLQHICTAKACYHSVECDLCFWLCLGFTGLHSIVSFRHSFRAVKVLLL